MLFLSVKIKNPFVKILNAGIVYVLLMCKERRNVIEVSGRETKEIVYSNAKRVVWNRRFSLSDDFLKSVVLLHEKRTFSNTSQSIRKRRNLYISNRLNEKLGNRKCKACKRKVYHPYSLKWFQARKFFFFVRKPFSINCNYEHIFEKINDNVEKDRNNVHAELDDGFDNGKCNNLTRHSFSRSFLELCNNQMDVPIDMPRFEKDVKRIISFFPYDTFSLIISLVDLKEMKSINRKRRNRNEPTDVISTLDLFPNESNSLSIHSGNIGKKRRKKRKGNTLLLNSGEIFLCPKYISEKCISSKKMYEKKLHTSGSLKDGIFDTNRSEKESSDKNDIKNCVNINIKDSGDEEVGKESIYPHVRGINLLFEKIFSVNERLPFYVIHGLIHLMMKDHEGSVEEYNDFMDMEEEMIEKYLNCKNESRYIPSSFGHYIIGMGTDILHVYRIYNIVLNNRKEFLRNFVKKVLHLFELEDMKKNKEVLKSDEKLANYVGKKFAAKEAIVKSMGRGLSCISQYGLSMSDIEIRNDLFGKPEVYLYNKAKKVAEQLGIVKIFLSVSDENRNFSNLDVENSLTNPKNEMLSLIHAQALAVGSSS